MERVDVMLDMINLLPSKGQLQTGGKSKAGPRDNIAVAPVRSQVFRGPARVMLVQDSLKGKMAP